ncbi:MAG: rhodanese-like domain-containing protein [Pseudomonadota bacterium]|nr:rhodanese [Alphaproteobacteria bacterium]MEC7943627.1 rhodanese-like domain-containing protein [Pseudomonadota bacterium]MEC8087512.1 rhodanese-like domain-containing protein [Pseudomonadota bacterium]MEC8530794.1 rhodanese-like domain-containing protein [Pseudomonadota bacterium]MEC8726495.1 rhodanese-like domain-containing protein [Pseudomonadota bacterium]|tara:strand:- start:1340 stop:1747 length:408 start_codon:yes stop_codon:yes gene_type:complete
MALNITRTVIQMVSEANEQVEEISVANALRLVKQENILFIDVRDIREVAKTGRVLGARHVPRGMLEMWIDPETPYHREFFAEDRKFIFYCASAWRSALAAKTAQDMGLTPVAHLEGGINAWIDAGGPIEPPKGQN